jgi:hypothetical protein
MPLSVIDAIAPAIARTKWILFQPFDLGKWMGLGFCAFLVQLAQGGGGGMSFPGPGGGFGGGPGGGGGPGPNQGADPVAEWFRERLVIIIVVAVAVVLVLLAIGLVLSWVGSRGNFMFLDGVIHNRGAVVAPWREYRREGNSLFLFRVCLGIAALVVLVLIVGLCVLVALPDIQAREFGGFAVGAIALGIALFFPYILSLTVVTIVLSDFIVPIMYLRRITATAAWGEFFQSMLAGNKLHFLLYLVMKFLISWMLGFLALAAMCLTCCVAMIPYIGSVILLPLTVFGQLYPLYFIEQFGPEWRVFPVPEQETTGGPAPLA